MTSSTRPAFSWTLIVFIQSSCSLSCGVRILEGAEPVEDEGHFLSGECLLAGVADPGRLVGQRTE